MDYKKALSFFVVCVSLYASYYFMVLVCYVHFLCLFGIHDFVCVFIGFDYFVLCGVGISSLYLCCFVLVFLWDC